MHTKKLNPRTLALISTLFLSGASATAMSATAMDPDTVKAPLPSEFTRYDANQDGYITRTEFSAMHEEAEAFNDADSNRDDRLDQDEYVKARAIDQRPRAGQYLSDAWISTKVKALLMQEDLVKGLGINVDTRDGMVQLSGWVDTPEQAKQAVLLARGVDGVKVVIDDMVIDQ